MPTASRPTFLRRFAGALRPPASEDLADMGTAFGLDQSLDESPTPASPPAPAPRRGGTGGLWRAWLGRKPAGPA